MESSRLNFNQFIINRNYDAIKLKILMGGFCGVDKKWKIILCTKKPVRTG
jgi:hypothetical protein